MPYFRCLFFSVLGCLKTVRARSFIHTVKWTYPKTPGKFEDRMEG